MNEKNLKSLGLSVMMIVKVVLFQIVYYCLSEKPRLMSDIAIMWKRKNFVFPWDLKRLSKISTKENPLYGLADRKYVHFYTVFYLSPFQM